MFGVETVGEAVGEFQFGAQLEVGKIKIESCSDFGQDIILFQLDVVVVFRVEIDQRIDAGQEVGPVVADARSGEY